MRTVAIPALTRGCPRAPASIKPTAAASTSPPSVSAGRPVLGSEDALAFLRTMRLEGTGTVRMGGALVGGRAGSVTRSGSIRVSIAIGAFEGSIRFARGSAVGRDVVGGFTASGFAAIAGLAAGGDDSLGLDTMLGARAGGIGAGDFGIGRGVAFGGCSRGVRGAGVSKGRSVSSRKMSTFSSARSRSTTFGVGTGIARLVAGTGFGVGASRSASPQISHSTTSGSLSAPHTGQRTRSRMSSSSAAGPSASVSNSAAHRGHFESPAPTNPPQFVQMNKRPTSPFSRTRFGSRSRNCFGWRKPASNNLSAFSRSSPKARLSRTTASSITKAPQFLHSVSSGGMGSWQTGQRTRGCFPGIDIGFESSRAA